MKIPNGYKVHQYAQAEAAGHSSVVRERDRIAAEAKTYIPENETSSSMICQMYVGAVQALEEQCFEKAYMAKLRTFSA